MTTEQMKELYETGEWVCVRFHTGFCEWIILDSPFGFKNDYKLIHKKHKHILDHVLSGGEVIDHTNYPCHMYLNEFVNTYHVDNTYEIIPTKQDLNEHYCLATKEHYDKLVEDGCKVPKFIPFSKKDKFYWISDNYIIPYTCDWEDVTSGIVNPMHLHNNEWVFGSLEHEEEVAIACVKCGAVIEDHYISDGGYPHCEEPKQVERITREELSEKYQDAMFRLETSEGAFISDDIQNYVSHLEANQKEK